MTVPATEVLNWCELEPKYTALNGRDLDPYNSCQCPLEWSDLEKEVKELQTYLSLSVDLNTADEEGNDKLVHFNQVTRPKITIANARFREKVLAVTAPNLPAEATLVLKRMRTDSAPYRSETVPLEAERAPPVTPKLRLTGSQLAT